MEHKGLTYKMIARNRDRFRDHVYPVMQMSAAELIDLNQFEFDRPIVMIDCCADYYRECFPENRIIRVEGVFGCKNYKYDLKTVDHIFDDKVFEHAKFPAISYQDSVVIMDHSLFIKYRTGAELLELMTTITNNMQPSVVILRHHSFAFNEYRFGNRLLELLSMVPTQYVMTAVSFDEKDFSLRFQKIKEYSYDSH
jgi:hypothetical protein